MIKQFIKETEDFIYKEVAKNTNLLVGLNKTAGLSTGLFLKLPIKVTVEKTYEPLPKQYKELETFIPYFGAYVEHGNMAEVNFKFMYHDEKDLKSITTHLHRRAVFFAFVYMHEVQHIIRKHNTSSYNTMMTRLCGDLKNPHQLINIAEDYAINYSIKDFFIGSPLAHHWAEIEKIGMYKAEYHDKKLSDIEILKDLLKSKLPEIKQVSDSMCSVSMDGKSTTQPMDQDGSAGQGEEEDKGTGGKVDKTSTLTDDADISLSDLAESLQDTLRSSTKGTAAGDMFENLFGAIKVETGWFKKIKASFKRQVYYKTHDYTTSWANLNNTFRKIYKSPKKNFIDDKVKILLSVDHSGSMATEDLQKLLYLIESEGKRISSIEVMLHDMQVTKTFSIENEYDITKSPEFKEALATRYSAGGTSHSCVFAYIQDMKMDDPNKVIYMSFSDNYSDIEQSFKQYPIMRKLTNYWISPVHNPMNVPGTNINMV